MKLGHGRCRLRIFDLRESDQPSLAYLRPIVVIVSDVEGSKMSIRSCAGHIATGVTHTFDLDPHRMLWVEYYPPTVYGEGGRHTIPEKYEAVEFTWQKDKAIKPKWRSLPGSLLAQVRALVSDKQISL